MTASNYQIGTSTGSMVDIGTEMPGSSCRAPKTSFVKFSQYIALGDGTVRGLGWQTVDWSFKGLPQTERDFLKTYCSGSASSNVYITTRTNDNADEYKRYSAVMVWPQKEDKDFKERIDFTISFRKLVEA